MAKITNKQTRASTPVVYTGAELAIRANAVAIGELDYSADAGARVLEFGEMFADLNVEDFKVARACWLAAYVESTGCDAKSAPPRFAEMVRAANVVKPQTEKAKKMQEARAAASAAIAAAAESSEAGDVKAGVADAAVSKVKMELSSIEAHIISLIRAGKLTMAAQAVADLAEKV